MDNKRLEILLYNAILGLQDESYSNEDIIRTLDIKADEYISVMFPVERKKRAFEALELFKAYDDIMNASFYLCTHELETEKLNFIEAILDRKEDFLNDVIKVLEREIYERRPVGRYGCYDFNSEREIKTLISKLQGRM